jgi:hypothetical protein
VIDHLYDTRFYVSHDQGSRRSADIVLQLLFDTFYRPKSIVDFGCGTGRWLAAARELGVGDLIGFEGRWIEEVEGLKESNINVADIGKPVSCGRRFDLAMCLEVAEHLPSTDAPALIKNLCDAAPVVLFSAAVPNQGGTGHVNEQWPSYWARLFADHAYSCADAIRPLIWSDSSVEPWYRQNILLFIHPSASVGGSPMSSGPLDIAHPEIMACAANRTVVTPLTFHNLLRTLPGVSRARQAIRSAVGF